MVLHPDGARRRVTARVILRFGPAVKDYRRASREWRRDRIAAFDGGLSRPKLDDGGKRHGGGQATWRNPLRSLDVVGCGTPLRCCRVRRWRPPAAWRA
ncbi:hypothetical protein CHELA40_12159 [Chelatococcus asaccharovorans]|nr:hypothetical protein CHELA40_12159 [Chelatococcus asaccharovorans]CAH1683331.1 hypothetical protein CHELA17_63446 [Chelatococcus asaccharovorans]